MSENNIIQSAIEAGREIAGLNIILDINGMPAAFVPNGYELKELPHLANNPVRIEQTISHTTAGSFIDYYNEFSGENSAIFVNTDNNTFIAIIDYHGLEPDWCKHKSFFQLKPSPEWRQWNDNNGKQMNQEQFGQFLENNLDEILDPAGAEMLEMALNIQAKTDVKFSSAQRLDNGQLQLTYHEEINGSAGAKGQIKIPQLFTIGLKLFEGADAYRIDARFRYRIKDGALIMWYELIRPHKTIDANIRETTELIENSIREGKIYFGNFK